MKRIERLFSDDSLDSRFLSLLETAGQFYAQALRSFERAPDVAYLHLITCGEILSNYFDYDTNGLLDKPSKHILELIERDMVNGAKIARSIKTKLRQVKRRFVVTITELVTDLFFNKSECAVPFGVLKKDDFEARVSAAYDLRSQYLHSGTSFGDWVSQGLGQNFEKPTGQPVVKDQKLRKALALAPTYLGLERIMRFSLLRFMQLNEINIDDRLKPSDI